MPAIKMKRLSGNYIEMVNALHFPAAKNFYGAHTSDAVKAQIERDIPRTTIFSSNSSRKELENIFLQPSSTYPSYSQGDLDGRLFTNLPFFLSAYYKKASQNDLWLEKFKEHLPVFCTPYVDDEGIPSAFALNFLNHSTEDSENYDFQIVIIKNIMAPPAERKVILLAAPIFLPEQTQDGEDIDIEEIPSIVKTELNSKKLFSFVGCAFQNNKTSFEYCDEMNSCVCKKENVFDLEQLEIAKQEKVKKDFGSFSEQMTILHDKAKELQANKHQDAADAAFTLHTQLGNHFDQYVKDLDKPTFVKNCTTDINNAKPILEKQRGWKKVLANLGLAVAGLLIGYAVAGLIHLAVTRGKSFFFNFETDSVKKLDKLQKEIGGTILDKSNNKP